MSECVKLAKINYKKNRQTILQDVNLEIESGKIVALLGENGAGKTTLMRIIAGLAKHYQGNVAVVGKESVVQRKAHLSMTDTLQGFSDASTIAEIKVFYTHLYKDFDVQEFEQLKEFMKLNDDMKLNQLSRGMKQKLEIALTLSRKVDLYLLDEPFSGIDAMARKRIINSILLWKEPKSTMIISDHFVNEITSILDEIVIIKDKTIYRHASAEDIRSEGKSIEEYYESLYEDGGVE
ncbi:ABC transporter ATP-binding protein [Lactobacillus sp. PV034]|uniref:ATP-binding cassette domain-containing protein n=1 Tax=Lactobacillus sp. PV034 TaxID=2594495 RepID=UPI00223FDACD|nr:ABC transporter ATP-binding protein [Lactobacillus sp. PV034]QNQ80393.1 ABC transporter ATP-binding protein [Lactobacillus sp. PV034]